MYLPSTMSALTLLNDGFSDKAIGQDLPDLSPWVELSEIRVPRPGAGQALIKVLSAAVNPSDIAFIKGAYG